MNTPEYKQMARLEDTYWWFLARRLIVGLMMNRFVAKSNNNILDIGSGTGGMTKFMRRFGKVQGIEMSGEAVKIAKKRGLNVIKGDVNAIQSNRRYDVVTIFDVMYHRNVNEHMVLEKVSELLNKGGYLILTDSARPELWSYHDVAMHAKKRFVKEELDKLVMKHGFEILKSSYIFFFVYPLVFFVRKYASKKTQKSSVIEELPNILNTVLVGISYFEALLLRWFDFPIGSSLLVVARKK